MSVQGAAGSLSDGLDYVFSFFAAGHALQRGKFDRDVRQPEIFASLATQHRLFPAPATTVLVTGSKGKGSCARLIARHLSHGGKKTGLILTPEELSHLDRIRVDGVPIPEEAFLACLASLRPSLDAPAPGGKAAYYHPPTAIFLLIGLLYFREQGVEAVVIEGGRGAQFDEIGQIPAAVGVVTSILPEHAGKLGPGLSDICMDKLALAGNCDTLVCAPQVRDCAAALGLDVPAAAIVPPPAPAGAELPAWVATAESLARAAVSALGLLPVPLLQAGVPPSCQAIDAVQSPRLRDGQVVFLDGAVSADCLDIDYMRSPRCAPGAIVVGLTGDKDVGEILAFLRANEFTNFHFFRPVSELGHVAAPQVDAPWSGSFDTAGGLDEASADAFLRLLDRHERLYALGVQVFLRSVRNALQVTGLGH